MRFVLGADDTGIQSAFQISYYTWAGIYITLFLICVFQMMRVVILYPIVKVYKIYTDWEEWYLKPLYDLTVPKVFLILLPWSCLARAVGFVAYWFASTGDIYGQLERIHMIISGFPQYMMILVHILLTIFWTFFYHKTFWLEMKFTKWLYGIYVLANAVVFPIVIALYVVSFYVSDVMFAQLQIFEISYRISLDVLISIGCLLFCLFIHLLLRNRIEYVDPNASEAEDDYDTTGLRKVTIVVILCSAVFILRAIYLVSSIVLPFFGIAKTSMHWVNLVSLWVNCSFEVFQFVLIVFIFRETGEEPYDDYEEEGEG